MDSTRGAPPPPLVLLTAVFPAPRTVPVNMTGIQQMFVEGMNGRNISECGVFLGSISMVATGMEPRGQRRMLTKGSFIASLGIAPSPFQRFPNA